MGALFVTLSIEYLVERYMYFSGGRYLYCFMVLTLGVVLVKLIGVTTGYQYRHYLRRHDSSDRAALALIEADSRNCRLFYVPNTLQERRGDDQHTDSIDSAFWSSSTRRIPSMSPRSECIPRYRRWANLLWIGIWKHSLSPPTNRRSFCGAQCFRLSAPRF